MIQSSPRFVPATFQRQACLPPSMSHAKDFSRSLQVADDEIYLVVNAGCREKDLAHIGKHLDKFKVSTYGL